MAAIAACRYDPTLVAARDFDFCGVHERVVEMRTSSDHSISHGNEIDGPPDCPPAAGPIAQALLGCAARLECPQYLHTAVQPERRSAVDRIAQQGDADFAGRYHDGAREITLEAAAVTEPVPPVGLTDVDPQPVISLETLR